MRLVLLHGFAHTPASWREVIAALHPGIDARAIVTPGHDLATPVAATWEATVAQLAREIEPNSIVVGYSLGARLALGLLACDAVAATILIGVNPGLADETARRERRADDHVWAELLRRDGTAAFLDAWERQPMFANQSRAPTPVRDRRRNERISLDPHALALALDVLGLGAMPDLRAALIQRADRAHLVVGADDPKFHGIANQLQQDAPSLTLDVVADSGHDPTLEAPTALAAIIENAVTRWSVRA